MPGHPDFASMIALVHVEDLVKMWGYAGATNGFREFCAKHRITPVPGRAGWYDPKLIRRRLDEAQNLLGTAAPAEAPTPVRSLVEQRRARRGAA